MRFEIVRSEEWLELMMVTGLIVAVEAMMVLFLLIIFLCRRLR